MLFLSSAMASLRMPQNVMRFLFLGACPAKRGGCRVAPVLQAEQCRVALGDEIGQLLGAQFAVLLIGERPGLSSPNSLGIYLTYKPQVGRTDADRNCISNMRPNGLSYCMAADKLHYLLTAARELGRSGVDLKDKRLEPASQLALDKGSSDECQRAFSKTPAVKQTEPRSDWLTWKEFSQPARGH